MSGTPILQLAAWGAAIVATLVALLAYLHGRRAAKEERRAQHKEGAISRVAIELPPTQDSMMSLRASHRRRTARARGNYLEHLVCCVYSGRSDIEVERVYLDITARIGIRRPIPVLIHVDLDSGEGLVTAPPTLPTRMQPHSRLDWDFGEFLVFFPNGRPENEAQIGPLRNLKPSETLSLSFGAFSKSSPDRPVVTEHKFQLSRMLSFHGPSERKLEYWSIWDMLIDDDCPEVVKRWFLPWFERRLDWRIKVRERLEALLEQVRVTEMTLAEHGQVDPAVAAERHELERALAEVQGQDSASGVPRGRQLTKRKTVSRNRRRR